MLHVISKFLARIAMIFIEPVLDFFGQIAEAMVEGETNEDDD